MALDLVINNGQVFIHQRGKVSSASLNIGVQDGKIQELSVRPLEGREVIDARNLYVLPGVIDSQVHFREPGPTHKEDLETGTRAAALGGITSIFEMPNTKPPTTTAAAHREKLRLAQGRAWVNFAFFLGASEDNLDQLAEIETLPYCPGIKVFMGSSTGSLLVPDDASLTRLLKAGRRLVIVHSEDEFRLRERKHIADEGKDVHLHPVWRDVESALSSTKRILRLAREANRRIHVLHVSTAEEIQLLRQHRDIASVEVLPNHLTLFAPDCYDRLGTLAQQNPPIREKHHMEGLWAGIQDGTVDVIGSDHAPHTREEKAKTYPESPSGTPGVQTMLPIMLDHVNAGRLSLVRLVELVCEGPRRVFGCPHKGRIDVGLDADFTLVDLLKQKRIENSQQATKSGWTPFDGKKVTGWPIATVVGGNIVMRDDEILGSPTGRPVEFS